MGNLYATQPIGREITIDLARHLIHGHSIGDPQILTILNNTVIHVIPVIDTAFEQIWGDYPKELTTGWKKPTLYTCNNITADFKQVGDQIIGGVRVNGGLKSVATAFKHMLMEEKFDLVLNIEGGSGGIIYPKTGAKFELYGVYAEAYLKSAKGGVQCERNLKGTDDEITSAFYREYNVPVLTAKVSCCDYPFVGDIPYIWRQSLAPLMTVLTFTTTGVQGFVQDEKMAPMRNATVKVNGLDRTFDVTKTSAHFKIMLPPGQYTFEVSCHYYTTTTLGVTVVQGQLSFVRVILTKSTTINVETDTELTKPLVVDGAVTSGIRGYVKDNLNHPIPAALVTVVEQNVTVLSDDNGKYGVPVPPGTYTLEVSASGYHKEIKYMSVDDVSVNPQIVIFTLVKNTSVWGMPRLVFVIFMGFVCFMGLGLGLLCYLGCRKRSEYGLLSQNAFYEDFRDFDESKEKELFSRPLPEKPVTRPYFDDDDFSDADVSSDDEDDIVLLQSKQ
ncbi:hypothetical protein Zmor_017252 [Zophobas morio]|uniref:Carboxypeptidase D n=1 Tax=Zophobas morio TaxID=2755281 RepID=A0AA38MBU0_9CUCU|nr:hypothetical protein Zmor_017252 [Zophobas morio]